MSEHPDRKEYTFGSMRLGQNRSDLVYVDSGEKMENKMVRSLTERASMARDMLDEISGASEVNPLKFRPLGNKILAEVVQVVDEGGTSGSLIVPGVVKPMQRHRALTLDGRVILFKRGAGELVRLGGAGHETEWIILDPPDIIGVLTCWGVEIPGRYVIFKRLPTPQQVSTIVQIDDFTRRQIWYLGEVWGLPPKQDLLKLFDQIIVDVRDHTTISHMGQMFIAVPYDDVMGIYTPGDGFGMDAETL